MKHQVTQLMEDIHSRINYWRQEANLTYAETIGALEIIKTEIVDEMKNQDE